MAFRGKFKILLKYLSLPKYYEVVSKNQLFVNFIFQRIFGLNKEFPFSIHFTNKMQGYHNMKLSEKAKFSLAVSGSCYFTAFNGTRLSIGEGTIIAPNVCIQTGNHDLIDRNKYNIADVIIGENCWLGYGVVILPGVIIGNNVTIGSNSVVTKSFDDNSIIAGVPAKLIKKICAE